MPKVSRLFLGLCFGLVSAAHGLAQETIHRLDSLQDSRIWGAVGRLDLGGMGFCTGALVSPDLVLTAAHCLFERETRIPIAVSEMRFLAGWSDGRAMAYRNVRRVVTHPGYTFDGGLDPERVSNDVALLQLDHPIRSGGVRPFRTASPEPRNDTFGIVSYAKGRAEAPSLQQLCQVVERSRQVLVLSCEVDFGASGAPVFEFGTDEPRIVSVISAKAELEGRPVAVGAPLAQNLEILWDTLMAEEADGFVPPPGAKTVSVRRIGSAPTGAKFVKP